MVGAVGIASSTTAATAAGNVAVAVVVAAVIAIVIGAPCGLLHIYGMRTSRSNSTRLYGGTRIDIHYENMVYKLAGFLLIRKSFGD